MQKHNTDRHSKLRGVAGAGGRRDSLGSEVAVCAFRGSPLGSGVVLILFRLALCCVSGRVFRLAALPERGRWRIQ